MILSECQEIWENAMHAFNGDNGFYNGDFLVQHDREDDDKYLSRQSVAYYTNIFKPKVNRYIGYLYKKTPVRTASNKLILQIFKDADNAGNSIDVFMSNFATNAKVRGVGLCLIDMDKELPETLQEQMDNRVLPYLVSINPEDVTGFRLNKFKRFEYVEFNDTIVVDDEIVNIIRYYDTIEWKIKKGDKVIDTGQHNLGRCPVVYFAENGEFLSNGEFSQVFQTLKRHYNLQSELDEILRYQTFPILTIQGESEELELGVNNALIYDEGVERPNFIAPKTDQAKLIQSRIQELETSIATICYDLSTSNTQESGIALDIKFQGLNSSLSKFSNKVEDFERRVFEIVCLYLNINNDVEINYSKDFSIIDVNKEIEVLASMSELIDSPTYFIQKTLQIINNDLTNIEVDAFDIIKGELEDSLKEE